MPWIFLVLASFSLLYSVTSKYEAILKGIWKIGSSLLLWKGNEKSDEVKVCICSSLERNLLEGWRIKDGNLQTFLCKTMFPRIPKCL